jgi:hypothetical protein
MPLTAIAVGDEPLENLQAVISSILRQPTPQSLVALQGALLVWTPPGRERENCLNTAHRFHTYLCQLRSKITAKQFSQFASKLDIGAVGVVALENALFAQEEFWQRLLVGSIAEGLMVGASRQYIQGWSAELDSVHEEATWVLTEGLWQISQDTQPELPPKERWQAIRSLLDPVHHQEITDEEKAFLLSRIFQHLLLTCLGRLLTGDANEERD